MAPNDNLQSNNGEFDLPAEMFRSSDHANKVHLKVPRPHLGLIEQGKEVEYSEIDELAIYEGDIVLGTVEEIEKAKNDPAGMGVTIDGRKFRWGTPVNGRITEVIVPFTTIPALEQTVSKAIQHWEGHTPIRFKKREDENDFISFEALGGCFSRVGKQGGKQVISLHPGCGLGGAIHEIGHALGLWHEQSREDRDDHVEIVHANINPQFVHNFDKHVLDASDQGNYDFGSIMHYPAKAFSINGKDTIRARGGQPIGQRNGLSAGDIAAIKAIYPDLNWA
ncbi:zinc metalloprotease [Niastella caeni]|uniref:Zinc metalloprotease n=1 Tax=Niastella caeni TaxID=2569763 RepID=A0A4S8I0G6_9BACT|nr:M12 family metallopeptidase [Niastella caeni]THU41171.1 zinc metalloprotease [Niastella caeni]